MKLRVVVIIVHDSAKKFLLQHRSKDARMLPDYWAFFGGQIDADETPEEAVQREAFEELRLHIKAPCFVREQEFEENNTPGQMYVFIEFFDADKSILKLQEGQGWGWFTKEQMVPLKMCQRDREIIRFVDGLLEEKESRRVCQ
ncbi:MAG: NUDIX domain-containing protein [Candidatus Omnitrophota bacterium]